MNRRRLLVAAGSAFLAPVVLAQGRVRTVGYLSNGADAKWLADLLAPLGYVEGRNLRIHVRARKEPGAIAALARELVALRPEVLVGITATPVDALAAATTTIPIICGGTADPIGAGYAKTLRWPGRNITGISYGIPEVAQFLVGLMRRLAPGLRRVVAIVKSVDPDGKARNWSRILGAFESRAREIGVAWEFAPFESLDRIERLLAQLDPMTDVPYFIQVPEDVNQARLGEVARRGRFVTFSAGPRLVRAGLLAHYSIDHADYKARIAGLVDVILRGANPAETPWELPDRTTFIVNRNTANAIGLVLPPDVLARATEIVG